MEFLHTPKNICKYYKQMYIHYFDNIENFFEDDSIDPLENMYNIDFYEHDIGKNGIWALLLVELEMYKKLINMKEFDDDMDLYRLDYDSSKTKEYMEFFDENFNLLYNRKEKNYYRKEYNNIIKKQGAKYFLELLDEHKDKKQITFISKENKINCINGAEIVNEDIPSIPDNNFNINKNNTQHETKKSVPNKELHIEDTLSSESEYVSDNDNYILFDQNEVKNNKIIETNNKCLDEVIEDIKIKEKKKNIIKKDNKKIKRNPKTILEIAISKVNDINFEEKKDIKIDETNIFYNIINYENKYLNNNYELILEYKNLYDKIKNIKTNIILDNPGIEKKRNKLYQFLIYTLSNNYNINDSNISRYIEKSERCSIYYEIFGKDNIKKCTISPRFLIELRKKDFEKFIKYLNEIDSKNKNKLNFS
jgi:hypothetical protein